LACSPILSATFLDELLKRAGLTHFRLYAYADDLVFCLDTLQDLYDVIGKLEGLAPNLMINKTKSAIMPTNKRNVWNPDQLKGFPIVD
jgi:hypothetical protein